MDIKMILNLAQVPNFNKAKGVDFIGRLETFDSYISLVHQNQLFLYNRIMLTGPSTDVLAQDDNKNIHYGVNYASADYLGLAQHPVAKEKATEAIQKYGISSNNTPSSLGCHEYISFYTDCTSNSRDSLRSIGT